jgi:hypothetical protein
MATMVMAMLPQTIRWRLLGEAFIADNSPRFGAPARRTENRSTAGRLNVVQTWQRRHHSNVTGAAPTFDFNHESNSGWGTTFKMPFIVEWPTPQSWAQLI